MSAFLDRTPDPGDRLRLFGFHHAGAGASAFSAWRAGTPTLAVYPVQLPGRERRIAEPRITDLDTLLDRLEAELGPWLDEPHAFYGHSMGALIAYALTRRRVERGNRTPQALVVGAYPAPHLGPPLSATALSDDELADALVRIGGMSPAVRAYPGWVAGATSLLRDDLALLHSGSPTGGVPVPLHVCAGAADPLLSRADAQAWESYAEAGFTLHVLPGGHFFLPEAATELLALVAGLLTAVPAS